MKKLLILISILITLFAVLKTQSFYKNTQSVTDKPQPVVNKIESNPTPTPIPAAPTVGMPTTLIIPKIGVNAYVEQVGQDSLGRMAVPQHADNVGWYDLGNKPGETGNAVIDGHLDTVTGAPAVFWSLSQLVPGDQITVIDANGTSYQFTVTNVVVYNFDQLPLEQVFGATSGKQLNLITCDGVFNQTTKNYSERIVIYSKLNS